MANRLARNIKSKSLVATLVTENRAPCVFCERLADDELIYGKLYAIGDIQCHYFCVLLSCCLIQRGKDEEGLFGFLYADILAEVERSKKHRCSFCGKGGATLGCSVSQCRKQFHLPCGRERNAVSLFYGNYKSFCELHAPKQKIPDHIMANARIRMKRAKSNVQRPRAPQKLSCLKELYESPTKDVSSQAAAESVCVICYEGVAGYPAPRTFWPPCCARDAWFHRDCLQRMALSAGMHYLKCPLCNDKENFYDAVVSQGYYVPDRDAAWELEQNAFADIYERPLVCSADECQCPSGKNYDAETGKWDIKLCILCGTVGMHAGCQQEGRFVCATCKPAAPGDLDSLAAQIEAVILVEQAQSAQNERRGPVMPSRMSLRRTKQGAYNAPSTSRSTNPVKTESNDQAQKTVTEAGRSELNLKTPKRPSKLQKSEKPIFDPSVLKDIENKLLSPLKLVEEGLHERIRCLGVKEMDIDSSKVIERVREKFKKPRPLCVKKKIVNKILENLFDNVINKNNPKIKEAVKEWSSPKKSVNDSQSIEKSSQENKAPANKTSKTPIKIKISPRANRDKNKEKVIEKDTQEINDKLLLNEDTASPKEKTTNHMNNTSTPAKKDSKSKAIDKEENKTIIATEKEDAIKEIGDEKDCITIADDESTSSTFELPPEFIANCNSDDSLPLFETPKKLKTVDIQKDSSLEICENDEVVNINHIIIEQNAEKSEFLRNLNLKSPVKTKKCALKFSAKDKEILEKANLDIDMESFKNYYLNEVGKDLKCNFGHNHTVAEEKAHSTPNKLRTAIDYAIEACKREGSEKNMKRKSSIPEELPKKKKKSSIPKEVAKKKRKEKHKTQSPKIRLVYNSKKQKRDALKKKKKISEQKQNQKEDSTSLQVVCSNTGTEENIKSIDLTIESPKERKTKTNKKMKRKKVLKNNIQVKIKFKEEQLRLKITKSQSMKSRNKNKNKNKILNQYVLKYYSSDDKATNATSLIAKPEQPVTPIKRKYVKLEKSPDNLVQTSIQSFFKVKPSQ